VRHLAGTEGILQFLDIGAGLPTANDTHEVAQAIAPGSRIVYVDNDPLTLMHARALLAGTREGTTAYLDADLRDTDEILAKATATLDFSQPVAIMLIAVLHSHDAVGRSRPQALRTREARQPVSAACRSGRGGCPGSW
jgi:hypothetical protein